MSGDLRLRGLNSTALAELTRQAGERGVTVVWYATVLLADAIFARRSPPQPTPAPPEPALAPPQPTSTPSGGVGGGVPVGHDGRSPEEVIGQGNGDREKKKVRTKRSEKQEAEQGILLATEPADNSFELGPYLDAWKARFDALPTNPGLLGKFLKPVDLQSGRELTLRRWGSFVAGVAAHPQFFGSEAKQFQRFAATPALYDDPDWHMSDHERAETSRLLEGL